MSIQDIRADNYRRKRKERMEEMLIKTRHKLKLLITEARELGLDSLLLEDE